MSAVQVDTSSFPIVVFTLDGEQSDDDARFYCAAVDSILDRKTTYGVLHRVESFGSSISAGGVIARWASTRREDLVQHCVGGAIVVKSDTFRFLLSSFQLVMKFPVPVEVVTSEIEAMEWLRSRLGEAGVRLPRF